MGVSLKATLLMHYWALVVVGLCTCAVADVGVADSRASDDPWKWRPEHDHPCTIKRMTMEEVYENFGPEGVPAMHPDPLVVVASSTNHNHDLRHLTREDRIVDNFLPGFEVTLSSSNSFSQHRRTIPLQHYLEEMKDNNSTTSPHQRSNESWYLFGETFTDPWKEMLQDYELPPCQTCQAEYSALSFGIGNRGSGVQWHIHGPGFSEALHGRKHWVLYPPHYQPPFFHHDQSTRNWMEHIYTNTTLLVESLESYNEMLPQNTSGVGGGNAAPKHKNKAQLLYPVLESGRPYECTLDPGDLIYFPDRFHHATINCDTYTAFVSTFTSDHLYQQDQKRKKFQNPAVSAEFGSEL